MDEVALELSKALEEVSNTFEEFKSKLVQAKEIYRKMLCK